MSEPTLPLSPSSEISAVARAVSAVSTTKLLLLVTGLLRTSAIAATFGSGTLTDAFFIAYFIPEMVHLRLMSPLVGAFVPVMVGSLAKGDREEARRLVWTLMHWTLLLSAAVAVAGYLATGPIVAAVAPGFSQETRGLACGIAWILLPMALLTTSAALVESVLGAHRRFLVSAFAPVVFNLVVVASLFVFGSRFGIRGLAWAFLFASGCQLALQIPSFRRLGLPHGGFLSLRHPAVRRVLWLMAPLFLDNLVGLAIRFVENNLASRLETGSVSALGFALRLYGVPVGLFALGVVTVILPFLSMHHATEDRNQFRRITAFGMRGLLLVCLPITVAFLLLSRDIVAVFYQHGVFDAASVDTASGIFRLLSIGLIGQGLTLYFCKVLYALHNTMAILRISVVVAVVNIAFDLLAVRGMGIGAIALGASIAWTLDAILLFAVLARYRGVVDVRGARSYLVRVGAAGAGMAVAIFVADLFVAPGPGGARDALVRCALLGGIGGVTFLAACLALRIRELGELWKILRRRPAGPAPGGTA